MESKYFSSDSITCRNCSKKVKDKKTLFFHSFVTPTIVAPNVNNVISLAPSFITPQDGDKKQDCELNASKRWLSKYGKQYGPFTSCFPGISNCFKAGKERFCMLEDLFSEFTQRSILQIYCMFWYVFHRRLPNNSYINYYEAFFRGNTTFYPIAEDFSVTLAS